MGVSIATRTYHPRRTTATLHLHLYPTLWDLRARFTESMLECPQSSLVKKPRLQTWWDYVHRSTSTDEGAYLVSAISASGVFRDDFDTKGQTLPEAQEFM